MKEISPFLDWDFSEKKKKKKKVGGFHSCLGMVEESGFSFTSFSTHLKWLLPHHGVSVFTATGQTEQSSCDIISSFFLWSTTYIFVLFMCEVRERESKRKN